MNQDERVLAHDNLLGSHCHEGSSRSRHAEEVACHVTMILEQLVYLKSDIDVSTKRADGDIDRLIFLLVKDILHEVRADVPAYLAGKIKVIFHICSFVLPQRYGH